MRAAVRVARAILTIWLALTFVFVMLRAGGDPAASLLPEGTPPEVVAFYRAKWGLDGPIVLQYLSYLRNILSFDFGVSLKTGQPVIEALRERIGPTLILAAAAFLVALIVGLSLGIVAALNHGSIIDRFVILFAMIGHSLPTFFLGIVLILIFSVYLGVLPGFGSGTWSQLVLPATTLGMWHAATLARFTRGAVLDVLKQPYMSSARAYGLSVKRRMLNHALPNAGIPILTIVGLMVGHLLAGAVLVESVFGWPGLGRLTITAVASRDLPVVQAIILFVTTVMVISNLAVDLSYNLLDPRVRVGRKSR